MGVAEGAPLDRAVALGSAANSVNTMSRTRTLSPRDSLRPRLSSVRLEAPGWHPPVRDRLEWLIRKHSGQGLPVAFDFDNTAICGDIGEATFGILVKRGLLDPARLDETTSPAFRNARGQLVSPQSGPDLTAYYEALLDSTTHGQADPQAFANGYVWAAEAMAGLSLATLVDATAEAFDEGAPAELRPIEITPGRTAYPAPFFHPETVELIARLIEHAFPVWIVSASNVWSVRWMVQHGLNPRLRELGIRNGIPPERVIGVALLLADARRRFSKDALLVREDPAYAALDPKALRRFRLTSKLQFPVPVYSGKVACLWDALGRRPVLAVGDSPGDHAMLSFAENRLWIARLDKPDYQAPTVRLMANGAGKTWLIQPAWCLPPPGFQPDIHVPDAATALQKRRIRRSIRLLAGAGQNG